MDLKLRGKRALVTGASRGLGRAIATSLVMEGCAVTAVARNKERLDDLANSVENTPGTLDTSVVDLSNAAAIEGLSAVLSKVDILVLNTGGPPAGPVSTTTDELWMSHFETMFLSAIRLTRLALPGMKQRGYGRILPIVSSGVIQPIPNLGISNAIRLALTGWAKTLSGEVAADGITVNCLAPGRIATDRVAELDAGKADREGVSVEQVRTQSLATIPAARYGHSEEFASVATFLASPLASYVTGGITRIDGGFIKSL
ncbi:MAG TPA: SDR family oxidoreductase [Rhizobium sp.]